MSTPEEGVTVAPALAAGSVSTSDGNVCPECRNGKCGNCNGEAWDDRTDMPTRCEHDCRTPTEDDQPLFEGFVPPNAPEAEKLSADQRRTQRQARDIANGVHPLTRWRLHPEADRTRTRESGARDPFTCGTCRLRAIYTWRSKSYAKCEVDGGVMATHSAASDVRAWWPACLKYEPTSTIGVSPLTSVGGE